MDLPTYHHPPSHGFRHSGHQNGHHEGARMPGRGGREGREGVCAAALEQHTRRPTMSPSAPAAGYRPRPNSQSRHHLRRGGRGGRGRRRESACALTGSRARSRAHGRAHEGARMPGRGGRPRTVAEGCMQAGPINRGESYEDSKIETKKKWEESSKLCCN
jgi:hypothetical protein